jgi:hypothetical protein
LRSTRSSRSSSANSDSPNLLWFLDFLLNHFHNPRSTLGGWWLNRNLLHDLFDDRIIWSEVRRASGCGSSAGFGAISWGWTSGDANGGGFRDCYGDAGSRDGKSGGDSSDSFNDGDRLWWWWWRGSRSKRKFLDFATRGLLIHNLLLNNRCSVLEIN